MATYQRSILVRWDSGPWSWFPFRIYPLSILNLMARWWFQIFFGEMIQFDEHIFQMGWNHQLGWHCCPGFEMSQKKTHKGVVSFVPFWRPCGLAIKIHNIHAQTLNVYIPGAQMTPIFEGQPLKTRPFRTKRRVIWVPGVHTYLPQRLTKCRFFWPHMGSVWHWTL